MPRMTEHKEKPVRRPYEKPEVRIVELKPEEALAAGCKTLGGNQCVGGDCQLNGCFNYGS
jgi:hypothetical protein